MKYNNNDMKFNKETKTTSYADEQITVKSIADNSILFTGIIKDLEFTFNYSPHNLKENNTVECNLPGLAEAKFYPSYILGAASNEIKAQYDRVCENKGADIPPDNFSQHTFSFENENGELLFTAKLLINTPNDWFETPGGGRRRRPQYNLRPNEKGQGIGYSDNIYLNPIKQLIAAGMRNSKDRLTFDSNNWRYLLEDYISIGRLSYPDGRMLIAENSNGYSNKLMKPGVVIKDCVEIAGKKIWYVADYSETSSDEQADITLIFESDYAENALLKFEGSFIRQSLKRKKTNHGYIAYYRLIGVISTVGKDGGEVSENIDLYGDEAAIEDIAVASFNAKREMFSSNILNNAYSFSNNKSIAPAAEEIGLNDLVGLNSVKQTFAEFKKFGEYKRMLFHNSNKSNEAGDKLLDIYNYKTHTNIAGKINDDEISFHMAFLGSPGTGKTTVAERVAAMLKSYGLVATDEVLVVVKSDLVGQHIGDTEKITKDKINEAMGRILLVDEAHTLFEGVDSNDFGKIALNEIMYAMESRRDKLVVILAGYTDELLYMLKNANPGLKSRISWHFYFEDYSAEEMLEILERKVEKSGYIFDELDAEEIKSKVLEYFADLKKKFDGIREDGKIKHYFGNGRGVRTFLNYMKIGLAVRLSNTGNNEDLRTFTAAEVEFAYEKFTQEPEKLVTNNINKIGFSDS